MPEQVTHVDQRRVATNPEQRSNLGERIWRGADQIIHGRYAQAERIINQRGETAVPHRILELAHSLELKTLRETDPEDLTTSERTAHHLALVMLGMPSAARAQTRIDHHESRNKQSDVALLSRFNKDIAASLAYMPPSMMADFPDRLFARSQNVLENHWGVESMNESQFFRTVAGVTREVAFTRALNETLPEGWTHHQGNTREDMEGTDEVICDPDGNELRVDVKSRNAFDHVVDDLERDRWIDRQTAQHARRDGVVYSPSRTPRGESIYNCIFDADMLGEIQDYQYDNPYKVWEFVEQQFEQQRGKRLRRLGAQAIRA